MMHVIVAVMAPLIFAVHVLAAASDDPASTGPVDEEDVLSPHASAVATSPTPHPIRTTAARSRLILKPYQNESRWQATTRLAARQRQRVLAQRAMTRTSTFMLLTIALSILGCGARTEFGDLIDEAPTNSTSSTLDQCPSAILPSAPACNAMAPSSARATDLLWLLATRFAMLVERKQGRENREHQCCHDSADVGRDHAFASAGDMPRGNCRFLLRLNDSCACPARAVQLVRGCIARSAVVS